MTEKTIFDKIMSGEIPASKVYEDDEFLAFLDIMPFEKGHTLVIPKTRYSTIFDMPEEEYAKLQKIVHKIAGQIRKKLNCGITILQNNISEQQIPWIHIHIIPRLLKGKVLDKMENRWKYESQEEMLEWLNKIR